MILVEKGGRPHAALVGHRARTLAEEEGMRQAVGSHGDIGVVRVDFLATRLEPAAIALAIVDLRHAQRRRVEAIHVGERMGGRRPAKPRVGHKFLRAVVGWALDPGSIDGLPLNGVTSCSHVRTAARLRSLRRRPQRCTIVDGLLQPGSKQWLMTGGWLVPPPQVDLEVDHAQRLERGWKFWWRRSAAALCRVAACSWLHLLAISTVFGQLSI